MLSNLGILSRLRSLSKLGISLNLGSYQIIKISPNHEPKKLLDAIASVQMALSVSQSVSHNF